MKKRSSSEPSKIKSGTFQRAPLVLVVDDRSENRDLYRECLTAAGYRVTEAGNGAEAIERAREDEPDLIVMDLAMPIMDGYAAMRLLKGDPRTKPIPIVVLTASGVGCHATAARAGCDAFLVKPCLPEDLEGVVRSMLLLAQHAASSGAPRA